MFRTAVGIALLSCPLIGFQAPSRTPLDALKARIESITRSINARWGIYIKSIETGEEISINADEQMDTMSTLKIPLMVEVYRQAGEGKFKLTDMHRITDAEKRPGTGILQRWSEGTVMSIKDIIDLMNIVSDNTATDIAYSLVGGPEAVNKLMDSYGYDKIRATRTTDEWFKALRVKNDAAAFHREGKYSPCTSCLRNKSD